MNLLVHEKSPYLLQHADNPVNWHPWGEYAFEKARLEDKPVFLSIGYSTCHWCHVMAHESFEDPQIAALLNAAFVNIKVDREERPDIDSLYMSVCQALTGSGGWPLTIVMTPEKRPFFAGTYFPKDSIPGRIGMRELIARLSDLWNNERERVLTSGDQIIAWLKRESSLEEGTLPGISAMHQAYTDLKKHYDSVYGGFGDAPKFPSPHVLTFLLRYHKRFQDEAALAMMTHTLSAMRSGGIYDHVGLGFHRYATDKRWFLPHFEKMLYDQALLAMAYTEAYQVTGATEFGLTAREILNYVIRDLRSPQGGFFSAEDADSQGQEGRYYLWTQEEIRSVLDEPEAEVWIKLYGITVQGNFRDETGAGGSGANVLTRTRAVPPVSSTPANQTPAELEGLEASRRKLLAVREGRIRPHRDEKILCDWNGLMIAALSKAAQALDDTSYAQAAIQAAEFCLEKLRAPEGGLRHRWHSGEAAINGFLDDYAFLVWGLIELYEAVFDIRYLEAALELSTYMIEHFWDEAAGGFFFTADKHEDLFIRKKDLTDGALPSGNSVAALNLVRLARLTGDSAWEEKARSIGQAFGNRIAQYSSAFTQYLSALDFLIGPSHEVVIVGKPHHPGTTAMLQTIRKPFIPCMSVILVTTDKAIPSISAIAPFTIGMQQQEEMTMVYVCTGNACQRPTSDPSKVLDLIDK